MKTFLFIIAALAMQTLFVSAREIYQIAWSGVAYSTNSAGKIVTKAYTQHDIIKKCAADNGISNLNLLVYAYVVGERNTEVVWAATGGTVCEIFQLEYNWTDVGSTNFLKTGAQQGHAARQAFIFNEDHGSNIIGSTFGHETAYRDVNGNLTAYSYSGTFQFVIPETGTIYNGSFQTGRKIKDTANPGSF